MGFSENLKHYRKLRGISQTDLAKMLNSGRSTVAMYETGEREPNYETLKKIARVLGVSQFDLLRDSEQAFVDEVETIDQSGNSSGPIPNYNTLFTGDSERDAELAALLEDLRTREDMRMLFKLAHGATPDDVRQAVKIIEALRKE